MKTNRFSLGLALAALLAVHGANAASSVLGDAFTVDTIVDGNPGTTGNGVATTVSDPRSSPNATSVNSSAAFAISWVDGDTFDLVILTDPEASFPIDLGQADILLSGLDFKSGGTPVAIVGATFNEAAGDFTGYLASADNPSGSRRPGGPSIAVTAHSVQITWTDYSAQLIGDQAIMQFDVQTAAVPEPASLGMWLMGLGALGLKRRRAA